MDVPFSTRILSDFTETSFKLKESEESTEAITSGPGVQMIIKEEDTEKAVTQAVHYELLKNESEGFPPLEQIKEELHFYHKEEFVKDEDSKPDLSFEHKPFKSEDIVLESSSDRKPFKSEDIVLESSSDHKPFKSEDIVLESSFDHKPFESEDTVPQSSFDHKPSESQVSHFVASVKLESHLIKKWFAQDSSDGCVASTENNQQTPGQLTLELKNVDCLTQNPMCSPPRGSPVHTKKVACAFPQKDAEAHSRESRPGLRRRSRKCETVSNQQCSSNHGGSSGHSRDGGSLTHRFELRSRHRSKPANAPSSSPLGSDSEGDEGGDPTWAPHSQQPTPHYARTRDRSSQPQGAGDTGQKKKAPRNGLKRAPASRPSGEPGDLLRSGPEERPPGRRQRARHFLCSLCHKAFLTSRDLRRHARIHSGEKPYPCARCGRCFNDMGNMRKHMLVHSGEKPHVCTQCRRAFSDKGNLRRHQKIHERAKEGETEKERFRCEVCRKSYKEKGSLVRHQRFWKERGGCLKGRKVKQNIQEPQKAAGYDGQGN